MATNLDYERRKAVANAWKKEKSLVGGGLGTRDWNKKEQREILSVGKATGYQGHHMKSVDGHNSQAGNANNIQFLNRKEHLAAHGGDFHNNTNGYYDYKTKEMHSFGKRKPSIEAKSLSDPLSKREVSKLTKNSAKINATREKARSMTPRSVNKTSKGASRTLNAQRTAKPTPAKGTETKSKTLSAQRSASPTSGSRSVTKTKKHTH